MREDFQKRKTVKILGKKDAKKIGFFTGFVFIFTLIPCRLKW